MKKAKKACSILLSAAMSAMLLAGCGGGDASGSSSAPDAGQASGETSLAGTSIEMATQLEGATLEALKETIAAFEAETGVDVVLTEYPRADYEAALKTRMAANELPDVFETHGWSRLRYSEYLMPVNDEPWYEKPERPGQGHPGRRRGCCLCPDAQLSGPGRFLQQDCGGGRGRGHLRH